MIQTRKTSNLEEITKLITDGKHGDSKNEEGSGFYFLSSKDLYNGTLNYNNPREITREDFEETHRRTDLHPDDILFVNAGASIGRIGLTPNDPRVYKTTFQKSISIVRANSGIINSRYLYYYFLSQPKRIKNLGFGSAQPNLLLSDLRRMKIKYYESKLLQKKIASILSAYDNLIENNNSRIQILEEMSQRIYKEWFVDFKYPGHVDDQMVDSELGMIPEGWEIIALGEELEFTRGKNLTKKQMIEGEIPVVSAGIKPSGYHNESNVAGPAVTISSSGANAGFISLYMENIWTADCSYFNYKSTNYFFYYYCLIINRKREIDNMQRGAAQPHVYPKDVMSMTIAKPSSDTLEYFEIIVKSFFSQIGILRKKNINLNKTRDYLLPKLISGKIDVSDLDIDTSILYD